MLAKWFNTNGEIFIFDEPTLGIDVGSKQEIYKVMVDLLKQGKSIIMVSSDMPEVISMSDRVDHHEEWAEKWPNSPPTRFRKRIS